MIELDNPHSLIKFLRFTGVNKELLDQIRIKPGSRIPKEEFDKANDFGELEEFKNKGILTRKECLYVLRITPPTLEKWCSKGILPKYGIEGKVFFKWEDILNALVRIT